MIDFNKLKQGECLSENQYYRLESIIGEQVYLRNDYNEIITVNRNYAETCLVSASQYTQEKQVTKTEAAATLIGNPYVAMTVCFYKQVKEADVLKEVMNKVQDAKLSEIEKAVKEGIKKAILGVERQMVGRHFGEVNEFGRLLFVDMEEEKAEGKEHDSRIRQVDPRTLLWFICRSIKYIIK